MSAREPSGSPTTCSRGGTSHSFDDAKRHVDRDLRLFLEDVRELYNQISQREGADVPIVLEVIARCATKHTKLNDSSERKRVLAHLLVPAPLPAFLRSIMDIAEECLETPIEDFKLTITDIVDNIEVRELAWV